MKRVRMRHPLLPDREIVAYPKPARLAAGWEPVPEIENTVAAPGQPQETAVAAPAETTESHRRRRASKEQE